MRVCDFLTRSCIFDIDEESVTLARLGASLPAGLELPRPLASSQTRTVGIRFFNFYTFEHGTAIVQTNDPDATSSDPELRKGWIQKIRAQFSRERGWKLEDTDITVDQESTPREVGCEGGAESTPASSEPRQRNTNDANDKNAKNAKNIPAVASPARPLPRAADIAGQDELGPPPPIPPPLVSEVSYDTQLAMALSESSKLAEDHASEAARRSQQEAADAALAAALAAAEDNEPSHEQSQGAEHWRAEAERLREELESARSPRGGGQSGGGDSVAFPESWTVQADDGGDRRQFSWWRDGRRAEPVATGSAEWANVDTKLKASLPTATLVELRRVENRLLWRRYWLKRREVALKQPEGPESEEIKAKESWLWHGTGSHDPAEVLEHETGLDPRFSRPGFYGTGLYLAERACYSDGTAPESVVKKTYAHVDAAAGTRSLLLCRAALGNHHDYGTETQESLTMPPKDTSSGLLFDSIRGGPHRPDRSGPGDRDSAMYVLYDSCQAYPDYIVTYRP